MQFVSCTSHGQYITCTVIAVPRACLAIVLFPIRTYVVDWLINRLGCSRGSFFRPVLQPPPPPPNTHTPIPLTAYNSITKRNRGELDIYRYCTDNTCFRWKKKQKQIHHNNFNIFENISTTLVGRIFHTTSLIHIYIYIMKILQVIRCRSRYLKNNK